MHFACHCRLTLIPKQLSFQNQCFHSGQHFQMYAFFGENDEREYTVCNNYAINDKLYR